MKMDIIEMNSILNRTSSHLYIRPHFLLRNQIAHYTWMSKDNLNELSPLIIVPDASGCIVICVYDHHINACLWGPMTEIAKVSSNKEQPCDMFFIEFLPQGAYTLFQTFQKEMCNLRIDLKEIMPSLFIQLEYIFENTTVFSKLIQQMDTLFLSLRRKDESGIQILRKHIHLSGGTIALKELSAMFGYSERHLQRIFEQEIGCNMKTYARMERMNQCVEYIKRYPDYSLTIIAQQYGYFDQAHFIHDFKSVCKMTPGQYRNQLSSFYNEQFKF